MFGVRGQDRARPGSALIVILHPSEGGRRPGEDEGVSVAQDAALESSCGSHCTLHFQCGANWGGKQQGWGEKKCTFMHEAIHRGTLKKMGGWGAGGQVTALLFCIQAIRSNDLPGINSNKLA